MSNSNIAMNDLKNIFSLKGKVVVITGAAGLLGWKHSEAVAAFDGIPILVDIDQKRLNKLKISLKEKYSVSSLSLKVDITSEDQVSNSCREIVKKYGKIDGLVLNAANNPKIEVNEQKDFSRLENFPLENWDQDISVGLTGSYLCSKYYGQQISKNPNGGSIVTISSDLGLIAPDQGLYREEEVSNDMQSVKPVTYSVVKTGLIGLTRYLATYWADKGVRSNAICPGGIENNQPEEFLNKISLRIPLARMAKQGEYQGILVWMLSDASSYLNGAIIPIDGGRTVW